jgi:response regulator RpfG family c-di-GMP phosphodiesterase
MRFLIVGDLSASKVPLADLHEELTKHEFIYVSDCASAYERWKSDAPTIVIIDVDNASADACDLIRKIRREKEMEYTYIVTISKQINKKIRIDCFEAGIDEHIDFPFDCEEIVLRLKNADQIISTSRKDGLLYVISQLLTMKDFDAGRQRCGVASYCRLIADEMRRKTKFSTMITDRFVEDLISFSTIHDVGKIGIDDSVLKKPGKYTFDEKEICKVITLREWESR